MFHRLPLVTATAAALIPVVKAGTTTSPTMIKPKDLPIYAEQTSNVEYEAVPHETGQLEASISVVRKQVWQWADKCQGAISKTKQAYNTTEKKTKDVVDFIKTEENLAPRAAVIGLAGLSGLVLARKGGVFRKLLYSSILMTGTASICYPYQTVRIAKAEYQWLNDKVGLDDVFQKARSKVDDLKPSSKSKTPETEVVKSEVAESTTTSPGETNTSLEDHGQSNPEDKDMYSTRK